MALRAMAAALATLPLAMAQVSAVPPAEPMAFAAWLRQERVAWFAAWDKLPLDAAQTDRSARLAEWAGYRRRLEAEGDTWPAAARVLVLTEVVHAEVRLRGPQVIDLARIYAEFVELRRRGPATEGLLRLLNAITYVAFERGESEPIAALWRDLYRDWPNGPEHLPKRGWLAVGAARTCIFHGRDPLLARTLLDEALAELAAAPPWPEPVRQALVRDPDLWIVMPERPQAGSYEDLQGGLRLLRGYAELDLGAYGSALADFEHARALLQATANEHRLANLEHNLALLWQRLGDGERALQHAARAEPSYARGTGEGVDVGGLHGLAKLRAQVLLQTGVGDPAAAHRALDRWRGTPHDYQLHADHDVVLVELSLAGPRPLRPELAAAERRRLAAALQRKQLRLHLPVQARLRQLQIELLLDAGEVAAAAAALPGAAVAAAAATRFDILVQQDLLAARVAMAGAQPAAALERYAAAAARVRDEAVAQRLWAFGDGVASFHAVHRAALQGAVQAFAALAAADPAQAGAALPVLHTVLQSFHGAETAQLFAAAATLRTLRRDDTATGELRAALGRAEAEVTRWQRQQGAAGPLREVTSQRLAAAQAAREAADRALWRHLVAQRGAPPLPPLAALAEVQQALAADELLVEWLDLGADAAACWIGRHGAGCVPLPLTDPARAALRDLAAGNGPDDPAGLAALAAALLEPLAGPLQAARTVLVSPDGALARVPFAALPWRGAPFGRGRALAHVPSASLWLAAQRQAAAAPPPPDRLLALGNPRLQGLDAAAVRRSTNLGLGALGPLPGSAAEVLAVARCFATAAEQPALQPAGQPEDLDAVLQGQRFEVRLGREAQEAAVQPERLAGFGYLHLACHGLADARAAALSCLVLTAGGAEGDGGDGLLRIADLLQWRGDFALVALSACASGSGPLRGHDGPASFARAALAVGGRRVLSTLWKVDDRATAALVADFYRRWRQDGVPPAAALAAAQAEAAAGGAPLRDWAAFVLWGLPR